MAKLIETFTETQSGTFLGVSIPELEFFKIELTHNSNVKRLIKSAVEKMRTNDYVLRINRENISDSYHNELSENLKLLFNMNFAAFNKENKTFTYYTTNYSGNDEEKKQRLEKIFIFLKEFEQEYKLTKKESLEAFDKEKDSFENYKDHFFLVKYHKELNSIVVMLKGFVGPEKFKMLARASSRSGSFSSVGVEDEFFDDMEIVKNKDKKRIFIIPPSEYNNMKDLVETVKTEKKVFIQTQEKITQENKDNFINYEEDNVFDFRIKFDEENKVFEFFCKGFSDPTPDMYGRQNPRGLLANWALNFILSEEISDELAENKDSPDFENYYADNIEISIPNYFKIKLDLLPASSKREKTLLIPADNWEKINKIYKAFEKQNELFSRPHTTFKLGDPYFVQNRIDGSNLQKYPAIYFDEKGQSYFTYQYRSVSPRKKEEGDLKSAKEPYLSMKGIKISFAEAEKFLNNHEFSENIKNNTVFLNSEIWMRNKDEKGNATLLNYQERLDAYESIYLNAKLLNTTKSLNTTKRLKI